MHLHGANSVRVDYSVSFDTHFITYVSDLLRARPTNIEERLRHVLDYVITYSLN